MKKFLIVLLVLLIIGAILFGLYYFFWTAENFASLAERSMDDGKYSRAVRLYEKAVELDPDNPEYVLALADACIADGSYTQAERSLVGAIKDAPSVELYVKLSSVYVAQDKLLDAQRMLDSLNDAVIKPELEAIRPAAPVFTPDGGEYSEYISVLAESPDGSVYCSFDEEYPSTASGAMTEPIALEAGETSVSAITVGENGLVSTLCKKTYMIIGVIEEVRFADETLENYVRDTLYVPRTEAVMTDDLWQITELTVPEGMSTYTDLRYFTALTSLTLEDTPVDDYSFLFALTELKHLDLSGSILGDVALEAIGTLTSLESLDLSGCGLSDISTLESLTDLTELDLSSNSISDIGVLSSLKYLETLNLCSNAVASLDPIKDAGKLKNLDISENHIPSLAPLTGCKELEVLVANNNQIADVAILARMDELTTFAASNNMISDISALSACTGLTRLELAENNLTDMSVIASMPNLTYLDVNHNQISVIPELAEDAKLQEFYASYNLLEDVSPLAGLPELTRVNVDYNEAVEDVLCLASCSLLIQIDAFGTKVKDVQILTDMGVIVNYNPIEEE